MPDSDGNDPGLQRVASALIDSLRPIEIFAFRFYCGVGLIIVLFGFSRDSLLDGGRPFALAISVSLVVFFAASALGCFLGFLFGIPRSLQRASSAANAGDTNNAERRQAANSRPFVTNTSLEDVSDWLTKIIIGIGLVQFHAIWKCLYTAAYYAASFVSGEPIEAGDKVADGALAAALPAPYFFALILLGLGAGCIFCYLETRTRLSLLFLGAQDALDWREIQALKGAAGRSVTEGRSGEPPKPSRPTPDDERVSQLPRSALRGTTEHMGWASAQARLGNFQLAEDALRDAQRKDPDNVDLGLRLSEVLYLRGKYVDAFELINDLWERTRDKSGRGRLLHEALGLSLYLPSPRSYEQAIKLSDRLIEEGGMDAMAWLWRAAAFGQKYRYLQTAGPKEDLPSVRQKALEAVRRTITLAPKVASDERTLLREIYDPRKEQSDPNENDLEVFRREEGRKVFDDLIYAPENDG